MTIASSFEKETHLNYNNSRILSFSLGIPQQAISVELFEYVNGIKTQIGKINLPSALIREEIKYIPSFTVTNIKLDSLKNSLMKKVDELDTALQCRSYSKAKKILSTSLIPLISSSLKYKKNESINEIDADREVFNNRVVSALGRINRSLPSNQKHNTTFDTCLNANLVSGQKSILNVSLFQKTGNLNYAFRVKVWFDSQEIKSFDQKENFSVASPAMSMGMHNWLVKSYLVDVRQERQLLLAISKYEKEIPVNVSKIVELKKQLDSLYSETSDSTLLEFEVK